MLEERKWKMYKGYKDYESWNVALYINNDYKLYWHSQVALKTCNSCINRAVDIFLDFVGKGATTPDGVEFNKQNCYEYFERVLTEEEIIVSHYQM